MNDDAGVASDRRSSGGDDAEAPPSGTGIDGADTALATLLASSATNTTPPAVRERAHAMTAPLAGLWTTREDVGPDGGAAAVCGGVGAATVEAPATAMGLW